MFQTCPYLLAKTRAIANIVKKNYEGTQDDSLLLSEINDVYFGNLFL